MTWTPTKQKLEDAALPGGLYAQSRLKSSWLKELHEPTWQPHLPTVQGKADLLDLIDEIPLSVMWIERESRVLVRFDKDDECVELPYSDKHAALMQAAITVAAQVGAKMRTAV